MNGDCGFSHGILAIIGLTICTIAIPFKAVVARRDLTGALYWAHNMPFIGNLVRH